MAADETIIDDENYKNIDDPPEIKNIHLVKHALQIFFNDKVGDFSDLLKESNALLAGGSILSAITNNRLNDLDIYVPINKLKTFLDELGKIFNSKSYRIIESSKYCSSFLRRNGIKKVYTLVQGDYYVGKKIDIMSIRNNRTPLQVVNNFDLTFCQTWYDGEHVYASHPEHIKTRSGVLQKEYVPIFIAKNDFLKWRVKKYVRKGFKISLDLSLIESFIIDKDTVTTFCKKKEVNFDMWIKSKLINFILTNNYSFDAKFVSRGTSNSRYNIINKPKIEFTEKDEYDSENEEIGGEHMLKIVENNYLKDSELDINAKYLHVLHDFFYQLNNFNIKLKSKHILKFIDYTRQRVERKGECYFFKTDEVVWDFHKHTLDQGTSKEGLEGYLMSIMSTADRKNIPCYISDCTETLKDYEIRSILDDEFWERFDIPQDVSPKVNTSSMGMILTNTATRTNSWGDIYHATLCPYCIAQENRSEGCAYMTHGVNKSIPKPYCEKYNLIKEIRDKYEENCERGGLQFCVTCGRPCCNHKHFNLDLDNPELIETVLDPAVDQPDSAYTKCMGGGRPELFARLLAIQKVILEEEFENYFDQRKACALAALNAPNDPELMARGKAIFDKDPDARVLEDLGIVSVVHSNLKSSGITDCSSNGENDESNSSSISSLEYNTPDENGQVGGNKNIVSLRDLKQLCMINRKTHKIRR